MSPVLVLLMISLSLSVEDGKNMENNTFFKKIILVIIVLFFIVSFIPSLPGEIGNDGEYFINSENKIGSSSDIDWWPMFHHDMNHSGRSSSSSPDTNIVTWTHKTGDWVYSSPTVFNDKLYIGSEDGKLYCLNANDGEELWNFTTGDWVDSSPAIKDDRVFFGSVDNKLYCLSAVDGIEIWNFTTGGWVYSSPAVFDGRVFFGS